MKRNVNSILQKNQRRATKLLFELRHKYDDKQNNNSSPDTESTDPDTSESEKGQKENVLENLHASYKLVDMDELDFEAR